MTSKTAKPMAHETGFPPNVEKYAPSFLETRVDVITAPKKIVKNENYRKLHGSITHTI